MTTETAKRRSKSTRLGASLLAGAALIAGVGAYAAFTDTETASRSVAAGELDIEMGPDAAITGMAPGDIWARPLTISLPTATNDTDLIEFVDLSLDPDLASEVVGQHVDPSGSEPNEGSASLWTDAEGLRLVVQNCDSAWTDNGDGTYSCAGTVTDVIGNAGGSDITAPADVASAVKISDLAIAERLGAVDFGVTATADGTIPDGTDLNLLATFALPGDNLFGATDPAGNAYENAALPGMEFVADAIQRDGIAR